MKSVPHLRVLVIEDDLDTCENICDILKLDGHEFDVAASAAEALAGRTWSDYHVILLDWKLPDATAETLLPRLRSLAPHAALIVSTGVGGIDQAITALRHGAADYIPKPVDADLLRASLRRVAEQQQLKDEKARTEAAFRVLVEAAGSVILILRLDGTVAYINPSGESLSGYSADELLHRHFLELLIPREYQTEASDLFAKVLQGGRLDGHELPICSREQGLRWLSWSVQYLPDFAGEPAILAIGEDVTARREAERKLLQAERLAAIGHAMTGLAHESRNALQRGQADLELLALLVEDRPDAIALVHRLQRVQNELHRLYEEVRQYAAPIQLQLDIQDLGDLAREAWSCVAQQRSGRDALLEITGDDRSCRVDRFYMIQVFRNLFENSLAATGGNVLIQVHFKRNGTNEDQRLTVTVSDNGPGIPSQIGDSAFDPFVTSKTRGTGLGLAIVRRIVEAHQGEIRLDHPERGARFVIDLPI